MVDSVVAIETISVRGISHGRMLQPYCDLRRPQLPLQQRCVTAPDSPRHSEPIAQIHFLLQIFELDRRGCVCLLEFAGNETLPVVYREPIRVEQVLL